MTKKNLKGVKIMAIPEYIEMPYDWDDFGFDEDQVKEAGFGGVFYYDITREDFLEKVKGYIVRDMIKLDRLYEGFDYKSNKYQDKMFTDFIKRNYEDILEAYSDELEEDYREDARQCMFDNLADSFPADQIILHKSSEVH